MIDAPPRIAPGWVSGGWRPLPGARAGDPGVCEIAFDASRFEPRAFDDHGIACPPAVARSVPGRQAEFFYGRLAARAALSALGLADGDVPIGAAREPVWPAGVIGSITHAAGRAAAVALWRQGRRGVGIDVERVVDDTLRPALLAGVVDAHELALLQRLQDETLTLDVLLTLVFSAKESLYKAARGSVGRFFDHAAARVQALDAARGELVLEIREPLCADLVPGTRCVLAFRRLDAQTVFTSCVW